MKYFSTNNRDIRVGFKQAVLNGLAPDRGLYFPESIPALPGVFFEEIDQMSLPELASTVLFPLVKSDIDAIHLSRICHEVFDFPIPLEQVSSDIFSLELFHGPTLAFKDVGARFMSRSLAHFSSSKTTVLVATSGDTGSAVADGFFGVEGVDVVILYPKGKVSPLQELQLTTKGGNIQALEVEGVFDDCQRMVKEAFLDTELQAQRPLTSANSINVARWLPQSVYYYWAYAQAKHKADRLVVSVPSGNFGNLSAGILAQKMGLPIDVFIAATNSNKAVADFLNGKAYAPLPSVATISNAMDVGAPSNFVRLQALFHQDDDALREAVLGYSLDDESTRKVMRSVYRDFAYTLDPHGAIAYASLAGLLKEDELGIFLETAHPAKFKDVVDETLGIDLKLPERLAAYLDKEKEATLIPAEYRVLREWLLG